MSPISDILSIQSWPKNMSDLSVFSNLQTIQGRTLYKWVVVFFPLTCLNIVSLVDWGHVTIMLLCLSRHRTESDCISFFPCYTSFLPHVEEWALKGTVNISHAVWRLSLKLFFLVYYYSILILQGIFSTGIVWLSWWRVQLFNRHTWCTCMLSLM